MMERRKIVRAAIALSAAAFVVIVAFVAMVCIASIPPKKPKLYKHPYYPFTVEMVVLDTPLLHTRSQIEQARQTGIFAFKFDGEYYVIEGLPNSYINYSARCARMP